MSALAPDSHVQNTMSEPTSDGGLEPRRCRPHKRNDARYNVVRQRAVVLVQPNPVAWQVARVEQPHEGGADVGNGGDLPPSEQQVNADHGAAHRKHDVGQRGRARAGQQGGGGDAQPHLVRRQVALGGHHAVVLVQARETGGQHADGEHPAAGEHKRNDDGAHDEADGDAALHLEAGHDAARRARRVHARRVVSAVGQVVLRRGELGAQRPRARQPHGGRRARAGGARAARRQRQRRRKRDARRHGRVAAPPRRRLAHCGRGVPNARRWRARARAHLAGGEH
ncbi:Phosphatidate cytidylyltransferase [Gracilaria domingensis]|nr:Phosphatidate cytidylyltransferase [Gracilaria domingensis]